MDILPLSIRKILSTYITIESLFIGLLVLSFSVTQFPTFTAIQARTMAAYISFPGQPIWEHISELLPINRAKLIHLQYYGRQFDIETRARTFEELIATLSFDIEKEYLNTLISLELFDNMNIVVPPNQYQIGIASWYGAYFHGLSTASVEPYNMYALTAAHKTLPLGTKVKITNVENRKSVIVNINDRGPFVGERIIDLSWEAARQLGFLRDGLTTVILELVE